MTTHYLPIGMQIALNGYDITLRAWNKLDAAQQATLQGAFDELLADIWSYSEHLFLDASNCNVGKDPRTTGTKFDLVDVPITKGDIEIVQKAVRDISYPTWAEVYDNSSPGCSEALKAKVGPIIGM